MTGILVAQTLSVDGLAAVVRHRVRPDFGQRYQASMRWSNGPLDSLRGDAGSRCQRLAVPWPAARTGQRRGQSSSPMTTARTTRGDSLSSRRGRRLPTSSKLTWTKCNARTACPSNDLDRYNMAVTQEALCFVERYPAAAGGTDSPDPGRTRVRQPVPLQLVVGVSECGGHDSHVLSLPPPGA